MLSESLRHVVQPPGARTHRPGSTSARSGRTCRRPSAGHRSWNTEGRCLSERERRRKRELKSQIERLSASASAQVGPLFGLVAAGVRDCDLLAVVPGEHERGERHADADADGEVGEDRDHRHHHHADRVDPVDLELVDRACGCRARLKGWRN